MIPIGAIALIFGKGNIARLYYRVHLAFAHAARDQFFILSSEIQNQGPSDLSYLYNPHKDLFSAARHDNAFIRIIDNQLAAPDDNADILALLAIAVQHCARPPLHTHPSRRPGVSPLPRVPIRAFL